MPARAAIYLDSNSGAPLHQKVVEALLPFLSLPEGREGFFLVPNPSSIHSLGRQSKQYLAESREAVADSLGGKVDPEQLVFVSSGSEANQLAIRSILSPKLLRGERPHWITTPVEHDSNLQMVRWLLDRGGSVSYLPVDSCGCPDPGALDSLWKPETALVSVVWVNNETGVIADVEALSSTIHRRGGILHLDAAQAWGKIEVDVDKTGAHLIAFSGHKIGGLAGTGVLWLKKNIPAHATILGKQEKGRRGGTENVFGIVALGAAAREIRPHSWAQRVRPLRDRLQSAICERIPGTIVNGNGVARVANTLNLNFEGIEGDSMVMALDLAGYAVSSGSACSSGALEPSHVLVAMGRTKQQAMAAIRVSLADELPWSVLEGFVDDLEKITSRMRRGIPG